MDDRTFNLEDVTENINLETARYALSDVMERLTDALDTKKTLEQKAYTILGGYITITMAIFGFTTQQSSDTYLFWTLLIMGGFFSIGIVSVLFSLKSSQYGSIGSYPDAWIRDGVINGNDNALATNIAYITQDYQEPLTQSDASNKKKAFFLNCAIMAGVASPILFAFSIVKNAVF